MAETPAGEVRETLEYELWHRLPPGTPPAVVDGLLALADAYAEMAADERIAGRVLSRIQQAERRRVLAEELGTVYGHTGGRRSSGYRRRAA